VSNSFKFTAKGGFIKVKSKYIDKVEDLSYQDELKFVEVMNDATNGAIEI
jgi:hypothetical protein